MKLAVVIPCRNVAKHIGAALRSVQAQAMADLETVVVDDASTDGTLEAIASFVAEHRMAVRVIRMDRPSGACAARNTGMRVSGGDLIQFLDADDALRPGKLKRQLDLANASQADIVAGAYANRFEQQRPEEVVTPLDGAPWQALVRTRLGTTSSNLFRRAAVESAGGWDEMLRSSQDYELMFRMLKQGATVAVDAEVGCDILKRERGSISRTDERENWLRYLELRKAMRDHVRAMGTPEGEAAADAADQYLFMALRVLSAHDRRAARSAHDALMPRGFIPESGKATSAGYVRAYRMFGFRMAELLAALKSDLKGR
ncbi:MAG: glycosyltransferase family 2 protein [Flavobacteriales bacterium]|nr:glycosyltransferase family 2 protein [Flavobacteriales bacterium]